MRLLVRKFEAVILYNLIIKALASMEQAHGFTLRLNHRQQRLHPGHSGCDLYITPTRAHAGVCNLSGRQRKQFLNLPLDAGDGSGTVLCARRYGGVVLFHQRPDVCGAGLFAPLDDVQPVLGTVHADLAHGVGNGLVSVQ